MKVSSLSDCSLTIGGLICSRRAFWLFFLPRNLFQFFPDCCAADGLGAIARRFASFNLTSMRLWRKRDSLNKEWTPVDGPVEKFPSEKPRSLAQNSLFCWEVSASLLCPSPALSEAGRLPQFRGCTGTVWTPCCLRVHLVPTPPSK